MIEQPWGDERLKMNGVFIGCVTKRNADEIMQLQKAMNEFATALEAVIDERIDRKISSLSGPNQ